MCSTKVISAVGTRHPQTGFVQSFDETGAVTLRLPANRLTQFNLRYYGGPVTNVVAVRSKGSVVLDPSYMFGQSIHQTLVLGQERKGPSRNTDHFGGEMKYFSDCILNGTDPEIDGDILCFGLSKNDLAPAFPSGYSPVRIGKENGVIAGVSQNQWQTLCRFAFSLRRGLERLQRVAFLKRERLVILN